MAEKLEFRDRISAPADVVMEKMLDMDFIREWSVVQEAIEPKPVVTQRTDTSAKVKIDLFEPIPTLGKIKAQLNFEWDLKRRFCKWTRTAEGMGAKSNVYGTTEIVAIDDHTCEFVDVINLEVGIPLVGKKMEKIAAEHMRKGRSAKMAFINSKF
jgi:hypothetical protein